MGLYDQGLDQNKRCEIIGNMEASAPEQKIIQLVEQHDAKLNQAVEGAIHPETQKPIPLTEDLQQIGVDATHVIGSGFEELMSGEGRDTRDRVASKNPIRLVWERANRLRDKVTKKAA